jgi:hypothetical protein
VKPTAEIIVLKNKEEAGRVKPDVEMITFNNQAEGTEMKEIGSSKGGQEMVEFKRKVVVVNEKKKDCIITISESLQNSVIEDKKESVGESVDCKEDVASFFEDVLVNFKEDHFEESDNFDLLASEIDSLSLSEDKTSKPEADDFELVPIPDCFNLDIPFEIIQSETIGGNDNKQSSTSGLPLLTSDDDSDESDDEEEYVDTSDKIEKQSENLVDSYHSVQSKDEILEKESDVEESISVVREIPTLQGLVQGVLSNISSMLTVETTQLENQIQNNTTQLEKLERLVEMGFANREHNEALLATHQNNLTKVLSELLSENDGSWSLTRH